MQQPQPTAQQNALQSKKPEPRDAVPIAASTITHELPDWDLVPPDELLTRRKPDKR